jgi:hypothetical protein
MEEMLISLVKPVMQVRYTKGRQLCYKDHIVNFQQDITEVAARLPRLPEDLDIVLIRQNETDLTHHVDFTVRRGRIRDALLWLIRHNPLYQSLHIPDEEALRQLPENGSVAHRIQTRTDGGAAMDNTPTGPADAVNQSEDETRQPQDDAPVEIEQFVGGVLNVGADTRDEVQRVRDVVEPILRDEENIVSIKPLVIYSYTHSPCRSMLQLPIQIPSTKTCPATWQWHFQLSFPMAPLTSTNPGYEK